MVAVPNNFAQIEKYHFELLQQKENDVFIEDELLNKATELLKNIREAGQNINNIQERELLNSYAGVWGLFIFKRTKKYPRTQINNFEFKENVLQEKPIESPQKYQKEKYIFFGREKELACLKKWIINDSSNKTRLVAITGSGGIGKTALSFELIEAIKKEFDLVIFRSVITAPYADTILNSIIKEILSKSSAKERKNIPEDTEEKIQLLLYLLRRKKCLILLDNFDTIIDFKSNHKLSARANNNILLSKYDGYPKLLENICKQEHQSCVLITSRIVFNQLVHLQKKHSLFIQLLQLKGLLEKDINKIFKSRGVVLKSDYKQYIRQITDLYSGNALAIQIVASSIKNEFENNLAEFVKDILKQGLVNNSINELIWSQFKILSVIEKSIMFWLSINREPVSIKALQDDIFNYSNDNIQKSLESLHSKSLVHKSSNCNYELQNVLWEYTTTRYVKQIVSEILSENIEFFNSHTLIKSEAIENIRDLQFRFVIEPILNILLSRIGNFSQLKNKCLNILDSWHVESPKVDGYLSGNILNILCYIKRHYQEVNLLDFNFRDKVIWQADLQDIDLHYIDFSNSEFKKSVFTKTFGCILSVAFSPNGKCLAAGDINNDIRLWNVSNGREIRQFKGHSNWIWNVTFSPDGKHIASGSEDQSIKVWSVDSSECLNTIKAYSWVYSVNFSPCEKILVGGCDDSTIKVWNINNIENIKQLPDLQIHNDLVRCTVFSSDGKLLASCGEDRTIVLWNVSKGIENATVKRLIKKAHTKGINTIAFSPDNRMIASGSSDNNVNLWSTTSGEFLGSLEAHNNAIRSISFHPKYSHLLASSSFDGKICIWDSSTQKLIKTLSGHTNWVWSVAFSPKEQILASGSEDRTIKLWDIEAEEELYTLQGYNNWTLSVVFSPDGKFVASGHEDNTVRIWDLNNTDNYLQIFSQHSNRVRSVSFNPNGKYIASGSEDRTIKLWKINTGELCWSVEHDKAVRCIIFSPNGRYIASGSADITIKLWNVDTGICLRTFIGHKNRIWSVSFSSDNKYIASGSDDKTIMLWDVETGKCLKTFTGHGHWIRSVSFSPDSKYIASGSDDKTIMLWDVETGKCLKTFTGHENWIRSVIFSPDNKYIASGSADETIKLWDIETGKCLKTFTGHENWVRSVSFSPDSKYIASGSADETIKLWDVSSDSIKWCNSFGPDKPYKGMNITNVTGITEEQKIILKSLGAIENANNSKVKQKTNL